MNAHCFVVWLVLGGTIAGHATDQAGDFVRAEMDRRRIAGLALAVVQDGRLIKAEGYGYANLELKVPVTTNTIFEIGSITKQFTASLIMMLVEAGTVKLDDRINRHLDSLPESWTNIAIRHLLTHSSGLKNYTGLDGFEVRQKLTLISFVRQLEPYRLESEPGASFSYCNSGYNLAGYLIEEKYGTSYWSVLREKILGPLGMTQTISRDPKTLINNRAAGYENEKGKWVNRDSDLTDVFAAGAMVSTVLDLVKWDSALTGANLLRAESFREMWKPVKLNCGATHPYGLGWRLEDYAGRRNIGHSGSTAGFSASLQRFPDDKLTVIVLCNLGEQGVATKVARGVADLFLLRKPKEAGADEK